MKIAGDREEEEGGRGRKEGQQREGSIKHQASRLKTNNNLQSKFIIHHYLHTTIPIIPNDNERYYPMYLYIWRRKFEK